MTTQTEMILAQLWESDSDKEAKTALYTLIADGNVTAMLDGRGYFIYRSTVDTNPGLLSQALPVKIVLAITAGRGASSGMKPQ